VKNIIVHINKVFENRYRLAVMSLLMIHASMDFNTLKQLLDLTDGNLASHIAMLEKMNYLSVAKDESAGRTVTRYYATPLGKKEFTDHLNALEQILKEMKP
jgi:DNA-binding MarR family transcriptional regulator